MIEKHDHAGLEYVLARIIQDFMQFMHQTGLSRPQIHALLHIYHAGECQISEIGDLSDASPAAASQLVERLVQQGLVERTEDPSNRRIKKVRLTDKSLELIRQGVTSNQFLMELMAALPEKQRRTVHTAFDYLAQASKNIHDSHEGKAEHHAQNS
jgi:DNA-binding MarR family transcriptional regulator